MNPENIAPPGVARRTVVTAGAWAVPVVALAIAAPLAAASGSTEPGTIVFAARQSYAPPGGFFKVSGVLTPSLNGTLPATVNFYYSDGFTGSPSVSVDPATGVFVVLDVSGSSGNFGYIQASAPGYGSLPEDSTDLIGLNLVVFGRVNDFGRTFQPDASGVATVTGSLTRASLPDQDPPVYYDVMPTFVTLSYGNAYGLPATIISGPATAPVASDGTFTFDVLESPPGALKNADPKWERVQVDAYGMYGTGAGIEALA